MQKKIIALAVAGLVSGAAFAQSNVTIYGVVDAGYVNSTGDRVGTLNKSSNFAGIQNGVLAGSRIGFKGEEALGNGLKAVFVLEYGIGVDDGASLGTARQSFVGLNSATLGQVALGRQYAPGYGASVRADTMAASSAASPFAIMQAAGGNTIYSSTAGGRVSNSVTYTSPKFAGFTASAIYGFGENAQSATTAGNGVSVGNDGFLGLGLNYANGPINADVVYHTVRSRTTAGAVAAIAANSGVPAVAASAGTQDNVKEWMVSGSYDFKVVKIAASYQDKNDDNGTNAQDASNRIWSVGAMVPVFANGTIHAAYSDLSWDRTRAGGSDGWALGYTHKMSKRTTLYTTYTIIDNDRNTLVAAGGVAGTRALGEKNNTFSAGINHTF